MPGCWWRGRTHLWGTASSDSLTSWHQAYASAKSAVPLVVICCSALYRFGTRRPRGAGARARWGVRMGEVIHSAGASRVALVEIFAVFPPPSISLPTEYLVFHLSNSIILIYICIYWTCLRSITLWRFSLYVLHIRISYISAPLNIHVACKRGTLRLDVEKKIITTHP